MKSEHQSTFPPGLYEIEISAFNEGYDPGSRASYTLSITILAPDPCDTPVVIDLGS